MGPRKANVEQFKIWNSSSKGRELLYKIQQAKRIKVEIFDTQTNLTTVCESLKEAGDFIGVYYSSVWVALKIFKDTGASIPIKGRYYVLPKNSKKNVNAQRWT